MNVAEFTEHLRWVASRMPSVYGSISSDEFRRAWFADFFGRVDDQDAKLALMDLVNEEILPNGERFMNRWYKHAKRHETERVRRESRSVDAAQRRKAVRDTVESGHCGRIFRASLEIPWDRDDPVGSAKRRSEFIRAEFDKLDKAGVKY